MKFIENKNETRFKQDRTHHQQNGPPTQRRIVLNGIRWIPIKKRLIISKQSACLTNPIDYPIVPV